jgi:methyltransferase (TIGR00027 family)
MKADRPSDTAVFVAMGRALAHARGVVRGFDDPFALDLLPDDYRAAVERRLRRRWPRSRREWALGMVARAAERLMGPRTVEIDDGLRALPPGHQVVILGAGLDARAYRMPELAASTVFEVDHPASQAFKRGRAAAAGLVPRARELRHVAMDFERDRLEEALARAGHAPDAPTAWIFEGVITYLTPSDVEEAFAAMAARSAAGSRLLATYNEPGRAMGRFARWASTRRGHEPARASFTPAQMHAMLRRHGFAVRSDRDALERALRVGVTPGMFERFVGRPHHVVVADFR